MLPPTYYRVFGCDSHPLHAADMDGDGDVDAVALSDDATRVFESAGIYRGLPHRCTLFRKDAKNAGKTAVKPSDVYSPGKSSGAREGSLI